MLKGESQLHLRIRKENEKWENLCWTDPILSSNINTKTKNGRPKKKKKKKKKLMLNITLVWFPRKQKKKKTKLSNPAELSSLRCLGPIHFKYPNFIYFLGNLPTFSQPTNESPSQISVKITYF
jgi:hypothetical protein